MNGLAIASNCVLRYTANLETLILSNAELADVLVKLTNEQNARQEAIYANVITNHGNIIQTFYATQQLKVMLGDIGEGLEGDREDRDDQRRRLQEENCIDTSQGFVSRDFLLTCCSSSCT